MEVSFEKIGNLFEKFRTLNFDNEYMLSIQTRSLNRKSSLKNLEDSFEKLGNFFEKFGTLNFENKYVLSNRTGNPKHKITLKNLYF